MILREIVEYLTLFHSITCVIQLDIQFVGVPNPCLPTCSVFRGWYGCISIIHIRCHPDDHGEEGSREHKASIHSIFFAFRLEGDVVAQLRNTDSALQLLECKHV